MSDEWSLFEAGPAAILDASKQGRDLAWDVLAMNCASSSAFSDQQDEAFAWTDATAACYMRAARTSSSPSRREDLQAGAIRAMCTFLARFGYSASHSSQYLAKIDAWVAEGVEWFTSSVEFAKAIADPANDPRKLAHFLVKRLVVTSALWKEGRVGRGLDLWYSVATK